MRTEKEDKNKIHEIRKNDYNKIKKKYEKFEKTANLL